MSVREEVLERWGAAPPAAGQLDRYAQLLITVAKTLGLIGFSASDVWMHITRALLVGDALAEEAPELSAESLVMDVGSGAGLPGIPISITRSWRVVLVEPKMRAVTFLEKCLRELELHSEVVPSRAEDAAVSGYGERADAVAARSLAPLGEAVRICAPLLKPGGLLVLTAPPQGPSTATGDTPAPGIEAQGMSPVTTATLPGPLDISQRVHIIRKIRSSD